MKVEYLDDLTDGGRFKQVVSEKLVRLYDFDFIEAIKFKDLIQKIVIGEKTQLDISAEEFIEIVNCCLVFRISEIDIGISTVDKELFYCDLTIEVYKQMTNLLQPFCEPESNDGYQWLYDLDTPIDLLFSPGGTW